MGSTLLVEIYPILSSNLKSELFYRTTLTDDHMKDNNPCIKNK